MPDLRIADLGRIGYERCLSVQYRLAELRRRQEIEDTLLLLEHDPVITFGRGGGEDSLIASRDQIRDAGVELFETDRGGDATYHGPGQLVGYPIFDLNDHGKDVHLFLRNIEQAVMDCLSDFGIESRSTPGYSGVWVGEEKICSIGVAVRKWVSYHGFALNIAPDFAHWSLLHPCGLVGRQVTSIERLLGRPPGMNAVKASIAGNFALVFRLNPVHVDAADLLDELSQEGIPT